MKTIPLTKGYFAKVDDEDYELLAIYRWQAHSYNRNSCIRASRGVQKNNKMTTIYMSRCIMNAPVGVCVDHINGDTLDNRKCNLRICNKTENNTNKKIRSDSKFTFKGTKKKGNKWQAYINAGYNSKRTFLGSFDSEIEAATAYNEAAVKFHGEFAKLNVIK